MVGSESRVPSRQSQVSIRRKSGISQPYEASHVPEDTGGKKQETSRKRDMAWYGLPGKDILFFFLFFFLVFSSLINLATVPSFSSPIYLPCPPIYM
jgi:hypothetical protein